MDGLGSPDSLMEHSMLDIKGSNPYACYSSPKLSYDVFPTNRGELWKWNIFTFKIKIFQETKDFINNLHRTQSRWNQEWDSVASESELPRLQWLSRPLRPLQSQHREQRRHLTTHLAPLRPKRYSSRITSGSIMKTSTNQCVKLVQTAGWRLDDLVLNTMQRCSAAELQSVLLADQTFINNCSPAPAQHFIFRQSKHCWGYRVYSGNAAVIFAANV